MQSGGLAAAQLAAILRSEGGLGFNLTNLCTGYGVEPGEFEQSEVVMQKVAAELLEKTLQQQYPVVHVYCEKAENRLQEKFRTFSGTAELVVEVRVTHDLIASLERFLQLYLDAITEVLHASRGEWGIGVFYPGTYEIGYGAV